MQFNNIVFAQDLSDVCKLASETAELIMKKRQEGIPMSKAMDVFKAEDNTGLNKIMQGIVIEAYESPRYSSMSYKIQAQEELRDKTYLSCIKGISKNN